MGDAVNRKGGINHTPIDMLLAYTACASTWASTRSTISYDEDSKKHKITNSSLPRSDRKNKKASVVKKMAILPYDPLFGKLVVHIVAATVLAMATTTTKTIISV